MGNTQNCPEIVLVLTRILLEGVSSLLYIRKWTFSLHLLYIHVKVLAKNLLSINKINEILYTLIYTDIQLSR